MVKGSNSSHLATVLELVVDLIREHRGLAVALGVADEVWPPAGLVDHGFCGADARSNLAGEPLAWPL